MLRIPSDSEIYREDPENDKQYKVGPLLGGIAVGVATGLKSFAKLCQLVASK